ncbi:hypothetical protein E2562_038790 [Oryza meyeriana var. granulata]|uniref:Uncharacterized protein n=1 Tax=Oryza meyeriana var. granulata TaxID=110450 RepID=A0A6G1C2J0_9ORYZ|nr:hypothetical protein E2562_038790 [Oryza meyeriana var. granulata]
MGGGHHATPPVEGSRRGEGRNSVPFRRRGGDGLGGEKLVSEGGNGDRRHDASSAMKQKPEEGADC